MTRGDHVLLTGGRTLLALFSNGRALLALATNELVLKRQDVVAEALVLFPLGGQLGTQSPMLAKPLSRPLGCPVKRPCGDDAGREAEEHQSDHMPRVHVHIVTPPLEQAGELNDGKDWFGRFGLERRHQRA